MIVEQMGYAIQCDYPECTVDTQSLGDYAFWGDISFAEEEWRDSDGYAGPLGHTCFRHTIWDEDLDESTPMPATLRMQTILAERRIEEVIHQRTQEALRQHNSKCLQMTQRIEMRASKTDPLVIENRNWLGLVQMSRATGLPYEFFGI